MTERIIQFGTGKFLRGFFDWMISILNNENHYDGSVVMVQSIGKKDTLDELIKNNYNYNVCLKGIYKDYIKEQMYQVNSVSRILNSKNEWTEILNCAENKSINIVISNTTEAGIFYDENDTMEEHRTFPAKLAAYLYHRYSYFEDKENIGVTVLPCELIEDNGQKLKEIILKLCDNWNIVYDFKKWIEKECVFYNTLVDCIVSEEKYDMSIIREYFYVWYIEGMEDIFKLIPFNKSGLNVIQVKSLKKYREVKVKILNAIHTSLVCTAYLKGIKTVREAVENIHIKNFMDNMVINEIIPSMDYDIEELGKYYQEVIERFKNPFIEHKLEDISLNTFSKFNTRILPIIIQYMYKFNQKPKLLMEVFEGMLEICRIFNDELVTDKNNKLVSFDEYLNYLKCL